MHFFLRNSSQAAELVQLFEYLPCKYEDLSSIARSHVKNTNPGVDNVYL